MGLTAFALVAVILFLRAGSWSGADPIGSTLGFVLGFGGLVCGILALLIQLRSSQPPPAAAGSQPPPAVTGERATVKPRRRAKLRTVFKLGSPVAGAAGSGCLFDLALGATIVMTASAMMIYLAGGPYEPPEPGPNPSRTQATPRPLTGNMFYAALNVDDRLPADYVVMVDVSASMREQDRYLEVRRSLQPFLAGLAPDDRLTLIAFADRPKLVYSGPAGRSPRSVIDQLPAPAGSHTDLGAAIHAGIKELQRPAAASVAAVVLLTDGRHDPPPGSPYPFTAGSAWTALARAAAALPQKTVNTYAIPLRGETGAELLRQVFPRTNILGPRAPAEIPARLDTPRTATLAAKARDVLGNDPSSSVRVLWPDTIESLRPGRTAVTVTLESTATNLPLVVDNLAVRSSNPQVRTEVSPGQVSLAPGGSAEVSVVVDWAGQPGKEAVLTLEGTVGSPWQKVITDDLDLAFRPRLDVTTVTAELKN